MRPMVWTVEGDGFLEESLVLASSCLLVEGDAWALSLYVVGTWQIMIPYGGSLLRARDLRCGSIRGGDLAEAFYYT